MEQIVSSTPGSMGDTTILGKEVGPADGTIGLTESFGGFNKVTKTFTFCGTTWLNNLNENGVAAPNVAAFFPWYWPALWINERDCISLYSEWQFWKPISVHIKFANPRNYQQISTGTTPFMIPTTQGRIFLYRDDNYYLEMTRQRPFMPAVPEATITNDYLALRQSFTGQGYITEVAQYLPNFSFTGANNIYMNNSNAKWLKVGDGQEISEHWNYHNQYWRSTGEFVTDQIRTSGAAEHTNPLLRADEFFGVIKNSNAETSAPTTNKFLSFLAYNDSGNVDIRKQNRTVPIASDLNDLFSRTLLHVTPTPQPTLLVQLMPDIGVQGSTGTCSCQIDFQITWTIEVQGSLTFRNPVLVNGPLTTVQAQPNNYRPLFIPVNKNWIDPPLVPPALNVTDSGTMDEESTPSTDQLLSKSHPTDMWKERLSSIAGRAFNGKDDIGETAGKFIRKRKGGNVQSTRGLKVLATGSSGETILDSRGNDTD